MLVVGFDCETTGLSVTEERMTEVGGVLWDTSKKAPIKFFSKLVKGLEVSEFITNLTGIDNEMLAKHGDPAEEVFLEFHQFISQGEALIAHNGKKFDFPFLENEFDRHGLHVPEHLLRIDTTVDIPYPSKIETRKQVHLAAEHGFVNPFPHRALTDVLTMMQLTSFYDWDEIIGMARSKDMTIKAMVAFHNKDLAKNAGYRYAGETKSWTKTIKESKLNHEEELAKSKGFDIVVL